MSNVSKYISEGSISRIVKYKLEKDAILLKEAGLTHQQIADELNKNEAVKPEEPITDKVVRAFLKKYREETARDIVKNSDKRMKECVGLQIDIIGEFGELYATAKDIMEKIERDAEAKGRSISPYHYKALVSEMRELLKMMIDIQREINDHDNIKKFMEVIINTIKDEAPDALPVISQRLKELKETQWFSKFL